MANLTTPKIPPALPTEAAQAAQLKGLSRYVTLALCVLTCLFGFQTLVAGLATPTFESMFKDFGGTLPWPTEIALKGHFLWIVIAVILPTACILSARRQPGSPAFLKLAGISCALLFLLAQALTLAFFLPVFQLGRVVGEGQ